MDKKKNFESYAKSLFGKAFGKKKSKSPLTKENNQEFELGQSPEPFSLRSGSSTPLFTVFSHSPEHLPPNRNTHSSLEVDLMFDSTEIKDMEDGTDGFNNFSPDFRLTQPNDVLLDPQNKTLENENKTNRHSEKKSKKEKPSSSIILDINANLDKDEDIKQYGKHNESKKPQHDNINDKSGDGAQTSENVGDNINIIEVSEKKRPRKDQRSNSKSSLKSVNSGNNLVVTSHGKSVTIGDDDDINGEPKNDLLNKCRPSTNRNKSKKLRTSKSRLEKHNSERDDSGISLNEGDDIFCYLGDDGSSSQLPKSMGSGSHSGSNSRSESDCDLSYFCVDHMKMCTSRAELRKHRKCQIDRKPNSADSAVFSAATPIRKTPRSNPRTITVLSSDKNPASRTSDAAFVGMVSMHKEMLEKLYNYAGVMVEDRERTKLELQTRREAMEEWIMDYVQEIIAIILKLKDRVIPELNESHSANMTELKQQISKLHQIRHESINVNQSLQVPNDYSDFEKYRSIINDASHRSHELETQLQEQYDSTDSFYYDFEFAPEIQRLKATEVIASVGTITALPRLPPFLSAPGESADHDDESNFTSLESLDSTVNVDGNQLAKNNKYCFTGCSYILPDSFVLTDWAGGMLKMISKYGLVSDNLKFEQSPWDVVQTCSGQVAVTVPRMRKVYFVEAEPHLKISKSFSTGCQCFGICKIGEKFVMTCDPWSKAPSVRMFDAIGNTLLVVQKDSIGENIFKCPLHICSDFFNTVLYVSDSTADCVYALSPSGEIIFCYEHNELDYPAGVATDRNNCLYVCGRKTSNIQKISNTGELRERFLQPRHDVASPCAITFHPDGGHLILTDLAGPVSTGFWKVKFL